MPNAVAYIALLLWPAFALWLFTKRPPLEAVIITLLGGLLLLPVKVAINLPILDLAKFTITALVAFLGCVFVAKQKLRLVPRVGLERWLVLLLLVCPIFTVIGNQDAYGISNGLTFYDAITSIVKRCVSIIPFILGLQLIKTKEDQLLLFKFIVVAAVVYSLPILWEIRMSPQLHTKIYGFFPHSFAQQIRMGGFRAVVFLGHGLLVAMFVAISLGGAIILWKNKIKIYGLNAIFFIVYLFLILAVSKTLGALALGVLLILVVGFMPMLIIRYSAIVLAGTVIIYPLLSIFELFPSNVIVDFIALNFGDERAQSIWFRFMNETQLLEHAQEKILFGWGGWGRLFVPGAIVDGAWIIRLGSSGLVGFGAYFGLMFLSVWQATKASKLVGVASVEKALLGHAFLVSIIMIDQIPNSSIGGLALLMWFIIGALLGRANNIIKEQQESNRSNVVLGMR